MPAPSACWLLLTAALLSACSGPLPSSTAPTLSGLSDSCRVAPNGGPVAGPELADRGIGGTGAPPAASVAAPVQVADRGIGGTGIIGVITGFASICVGGQEVGYTPALPVLVDGQQGNAADLRAGQLAMIDASGPAAGLVAQRVRVRHEVIGPVQTNEPDGAHGAMLRVAGQLVAVMPSTLGVTAPGVGDWVAISGFHDSDGVIRATRLDAWQRGQALISGKLVEDGGHLRIGIAEIMPPPGVMLVPGQDVVLVGRWSDGVLYVVGQEADLLVDQPAAYFDAGTGSIVVESYAGLNDGRLVLGRMRQSVGGASVARSIVELSRRPDGALHPVIARPAPSGPRGVTAMPGRFGGEAAAGRFQPAPVPRYTPAEGAHHGPARPGGSGQRDGRAQDRSGRGNDAPQPTSLEGFGLPGLGNPGSPFPGGQGPGRGH